jgi:hypothetical protein
MEGSRAEPSETTPNTYFHKQAKGTNKPKHLRLVKRHKFILKHDKNNNLV